MKCKNVKKRCLHLSWPPHRPAGSPADQEGGAPPWLPENTQFIFLSFYLFLSLFSLFSFPWSPSYFIFINYSEIDQSHDHRSNPLKSEWTWQLASYQQFVQVDLDQKIKQTKENIKSFSRSSTLWELLIFVECFWKMRISLRGVWST